MGNELFKPENKTSVKRAEIKNIKLQSNSLGLGDRSGGQMLYNPNSPQWLQLLFSCNEWEILIKAKQLLTKLTSEK